MRGCFDILRTLFLVIIASALGVFLGQSELASRCNDTSTRSAT